MKRLFESLLTLGLMALLTLNLAGCGGGDEGVDEGMDVDGGAMSGDEGIEADPADAMMGDDDAIADEGGEAEIPPIAIVEPAEGAPEAEPAEEPAAEPAEEPTAEEPPAN